MFRAVALVTTCFVLSVDFEYIGKRNDIEKLVTYTTVAVKSKIKGKFCLFSEFP